MRGIKILLIYSFCLFAINSLAAEFPYCTNGSDNGNGYGWDPAVIDPNGSHSCLVPIVPATPDVPNVPATPGVPNTPNNTEISKWTAGGPGQSCKTPNYTCSGTLRQIGCNANVTDSALTSHCHALFGGYGVVHCFVTDSSGKVTSRFLDACP